MADAVAYKDAVIEVAKEVYSILGEGNLESVYERAMAIEFRQRGIPYAVENNVEVLYKGEYVGTQRLDFVISGILAVELKAGGSITKGHESQTRAYMRTADFANAIIINFPSPAKDEPDIRVI